MWGKTVRRPHRVRATGCPPAPLRYDAAGPCPDAARRTSRPSPERRRATGERARQAATTQKHAPLGTSSSTSAVRTPGTDRCTHTSRPGSPQHMRRRMPTTMACMVCRRGSRWRDKFNLGILLHYFIKA